MASIPYHQLVLGKEYIIMKDNFLYKGVYYMHYNKMESLIKIPFKKLVLKKQYIIKTNGLIYTGTYHYMFRPDDIITDLLGFGRPAFIDFKPNIDNQILLICKSTDEFYEKDEFL